MKFFFLLLFIGNLDEQQSSPSRQSSTSPHDHSPKMKFARRLNQVQTFLNNKRNGYFFVLSFSHIHLHLMLNRNHHYPQVEIIHQV